MKKYIIGLLALLCLLMGVTLAWASTADDIRHALEQMPAHLEVKFKSIESQGDKAVINQLLIKNLLPEDKAQNAEQAYELSIDSLEITNANVNAFKDPNPSMLADKIVAKGVKLLHPLTKDNLAIKQISMDKPVAPWANLQQITDKNSEQYWLQLAHARIEGLAIDNLVAVGPGNNASMLNIERLNAQNFSLLYCTDMRMRNFKVTDATASEVETFAIGEVKFNYNFYDYLLPMLEKGKFSMEDLHQLDPTNKYDYDLLLSSIKSTMGNFPFSIKSISFGQNNHDNFHGKFSLDSFRIEANDVKQVGFFGNDISKHLLNNKPFIFSMDINSNMAINKYLPNYIKLQMPGVANLEFQASMALKSDYLKNWIEGRTVYGDDILDMDSQLEFMMKNSLFKEIVFSYYDKGLINGLLSYYAASHGMSKAQAKSDMLAHVDREMGDNSQNGMYHDFLKSLKALLQKPGTWVWTFTPAKPMDLDAFKHLDLDKNPELLKYSFKVK